MIRTKYLFALALAAAPLLGACGDDEDPATDRDTGTEADAGTTDGGSTETDTGTGEDAVEDTGTGEDAVEDSGTGEDAVEDSGTGEDAVEDSGTGEDAVEDSGIDAETDTGVDADTDAETDTGADADADTDADASGECDTIADVRAATVGDVDLTLCDVVVTRVDELGFYMQSDAEGPGTFSFEGFEWDNAEGIAEGDVVSFDVTSVSEFAGNQQIASHGDVTIESSGFDLGTIVQDLSAGTLPSEDLEAELVSVTGAEVTAIDGRNITLAYGTATDAAMFVDAGVETSFCVGATFDVEAVVTEFEDDSLHQIRVFDFDSEVTSLDIAGCEGGEGDSLADLRAADEGAVSFELTGLVVTRVNGIGYYMQEADTDGPGIFVFEGFDWENTEGVANGDTISITVTELGSFRGNTQVTAHDPITIEDSGFDLDSIAQDLSAGVIPAEEHESELITITGAGVVAIDGSDITLTYGTAESVNLRAEADSAEFCVGAVLDVTAVVTENEPGGFHQVRVDNFFEEVTTFDDEGCETSDAPAPGVDDLVINEIHADPAADDGDTAPGDANCDGTRDTEDDEFVELVNVSGGPLNMAGVSISDGVSVRHIFPAGYELAVGEGVVVFGGGDPSCANFEATNVTTASSGGLGLNNSGDTVTLTLDDLELASYEYGSEGGSDQSITRSPDITGEFEQHSVADTDDASLFSPGFRLDGTDFE